MVSPPRIASPFDNGTRAAGPVQSAAGGAASTAAAAINKFFENATLTFQGVKDAEHAVTRLLEGDAQATGA